MKVLDSDLKKLIKVENKIIKICEEFGILVPEIEFNVVPPQKMLEIMAYGYATQISNWKFGRDYERYKTMFERSRFSLPFEVVCYGKPHRAFLMNDNPYGVQVMVIAHVFAHCHFYHVNKFFVNSGIDDISIILSEACKRFEEYEKKYGIDAVEKVVDAAHSIMMHLDVTDITLTESDRRKQEIEKAKISFGKNVDKSIFSDVIGGKQDITTYEYENYIDVISRKAPARPTEDLLGVIIEYTQLPEWKKDILSVIRRFGRIHYPFIHTKYLNEGFSTFIHEKIIYRLMEEKFISSEDYGVFSYVNSLVKSSNYFSLNPYKLVCSILNDVERRWDDKDFQCNDSDGCVYCSYDVMVDSSLDGFSKVMNLIKDHNDWLLFYNFLNGNIIRNENLYLYEIKEDSESIIYSVKSKNPEKIRKKILDKFGRKSIPTILVTNYDKDRMDLICIYDGRKLDEKYALKTMEHISNLTNTSVYLKYFGKDDEKQIIYNKR